MKRKKWLIPLFVFTAGCWWTALLCDLAGGAHPLAAVLAGFCAVTWTAWAVRWIVQSRMESTEERDHETETPPHSP